MPHGQQQQRHQCSVDLGLASGGDSAAEAADKTAGNRMRSKMEFWHASVAKNTAHGFAMASELERSALVRDTPVAAAGSAAGAGGSWAAEPPRHHPDEMVLRDLVLISCDCDNVFSSDFVIEALTVAMSSRRFSTSPVVADPPMSPACYSRGNQSCLTGRVLYWASDFLRIGGYDQEEGVVGSGYQDVDITYRMHKATGSRSQGRGTALTKWLGLGVPNKVGATLREERGPVKVENCSPGDLAQMKTWGNFNTHNMTLMKKKTAAGILVRNLEYPFGGGAPNLASHLRLLLRASAASTGALWVSAQARSMPASHGHVALVVSGQPRVLQDAASSR